MVAPSKKRLGPKDWLFLALFGLAICAGVGLFVNHYGSPAPVVFDEAVHAETNPFIADIRAMTQVVRQRYAYLGHRRTLDGLDLKALEASALAELGAGDDEAAFRRAASQSPGASHARAQTPGKAVPYPSAVHTRATGLTRDCEHRLAA